MPNAPMATMVDSNGILHIYLHLKNAYVNDDDKAVAGAGNEMVKVLNDLIKWIGDDERKQFEDMVNDMKANAEHIGANLVTSEGSANICKVHFF